MGCIRITVLGKISEFKILAVDQRLARSSLPLLMSRVRVQREKSASGRKMAKNCPSCAIGRLISDFNIVEKVEGNSSEEVTNGESELRNKFALFYRVISSGKIQ